MAAGNQALDANFKVFTVAPAANTYTWPTLGTVTGTLATSTMTSCTIVIAGGGAASNIAKDFNVHLCAAGTSSPYWTPGTTVFNCTVTGYLQILGNWTLSFDCTPWISGNCFFAVYVRSGEGTGALGTSASTTLGVLASSTVYVTPPAVGFALPSLARQAAKQTGSGQPTIAYGNYGQFVGQGASSGLCRYFYPNNEYGELAGPVYLYLGYVYMGGLRALHPNQIGGSPYVTDGLVPASDPSGSWAMFPGSVNGYFASHGFVINKVMTGDFTLVIKSDTNHPVVSMAYRSTQFDPTLACAFYNFTRTSWATYGPPWGWDGAISGSTLNTSCGVYLTSSKGNSNATWWYRYKRAGNALTIEWGTSVGAISNNAISATCNTGDFVGCFIGAAGANGTASEVVSFSGTTA